MVGLELGAEVAAFDADHGDCGQQQGEGAEDDQAADVDAVGEWVVAGVVVVRGARYLSQLMALTSGARLLISQPRMATAAATPVASDLRPVPAPRASATAPVANPKKASWMARRRCARS